MTVKVTPNGTYGPPMPNPPGILKNLLYLFINTVVKVQGGKVLKLTTVGSKSGKERTTPLAWFPDGENAWLVIGSAGGDAKHPGWIFNMAKNPDKIWIEVDGRKIHVKAETLEGDAYHTAWTKAAKQLPQYNGYIQKTDRLIPVVRLTPYD
jgi:deazaflavin-dependent oxidoreductase (nitroreductase family)